MDFAALVGFLALAYAGIVRALQEKLVNRKEVEAVQAESKRLSAEFKKAQKANDKKRMDRIMKEQMDHLPKLNGVMMKQFKPMFVILAIFACFIYLVDHIDPFTQDDFVVRMVDDGSGCDAVAGDGIYSACIRPEGNPGKWTAHVRAYEGSHEIAGNETYFLYDVSEWADTYVEDGKGRGMEVATDKKTYLHGETVTLTAAPPDMADGMSFIIQITAPREVEVDKVEATISSGTYFRADLPVEIPILNIKSFYQPYWWFIFISLIANLSIGFVIGRMRKKSEKR